MSGIGLSQMAGISVSHEWDAALSRHAPRSPVWRISLSCDIASLALLRHSSHDGGGEVDRVSPTTPTDRSADSDVARF